VSGRDAGADVAVIEHGDGLAVYVRGEPIASAVAVEARPGNVAAAVAVALELGVAPGEVARRMATLPTAPHRLDRSVGAGGVLVLDDTYNANPAGARAALATLERLGRDAGRRVVVTPGMVELGRLQAAENTAFGRAAGAVATDLVVVGRTNRRDLLRGALGGAAHGGDAGGGGSAGDAADAPGPARAVTVRTRQQATAWVRAHLGRGDVVLYENDLPDHYP